MKINWKKVKFSDVVDVNPSVKLVKGEEYHFVPMEDVEALTSFLRTDKYKKYEGSSSSKFKHNDILFARITPCLQNRKITQIKLGEGKKGFGSTEFFIFRGKKGLISQTFLNYYTRTNSFVESAVNSMVGASGRQRADKNYISNLEILIPEVEEQNEIGNILLGYDKLIENNTKRIAILEQIAEQLYKEWFVRMRFPNNENTRFIKGIPEGWKTKKLGNVIETTKGYAFKSAWFNETGDVAVVKVSDFNLDSIDSSNLVYLTEEYRERYKKHKLNTGAVVIQTVGSWPSNPESVVGKVIKVPSFVDGALLNQNAVILKSETLSDNYLYHTLKYNSFKEYIEGCAQGAASQASITLDSIKKFSLLIPKEELLIKFDNFVNPINNEINNLVIQNQNLRKTRDLLLPRLISGKLKVQAEVEKQIEIQEPITAFYQKQILAHIINKQEEHQVAQGEMVLAKNTYLIDKIYGVHTGFNWKNWHYGTYDGKIRTLINGRDRFFKKQEVGSSGYKVLVLGENKDKILDKKYHHPTFDTIDTAMEELLSIYAKYPVKERSHKIELLNTTCKAIADTQSVDSEIIHNAFKAWKTPKAKFATKGQKFNPIETKQCIKFIISKEWDKKLITS